MLRSLKRMGNFLFALTMGLIGFAAVSLFVLASVSLPRDNRTIIEAARSTCIQLARSHLRDRSASDEIQFAVVANTSSDPTPNAFDFIWGRRELIGYVRLARYSEPDEPTQGVWCRGVAGWEGITFLRVEGDELIASPRPF